ncbi:PrsW family glutamic-type intramembrane protease [Streptomyces beihaiensis]|uniref:PrsW family glutamic-type intramembrane protease n=1 Tax=Streptomyces beihaiensis TaxID=2984495 RepID=A0ABT3TSG3_9ACTN|nr:PrsW family glutamic-type intramembrane protease [Streptomyces beihaiensis]MCX3059984.1 PrsW family glutamic-type intramembrane protease [Streptomyces beihaiensis]
MNRLRGPLRPLSASFRDDSLVRARALLVARLFTALYLVELGVNLVRPHLLPHEPALSIFYSYKGVQGKLNRLLATPEAVFWVVLAGIALGAVLQIAAAVVRRFGNGLTDRRAATLTWITVGCLLLPPGLIPIVVLTEFFPVTLLCVPTTLAVLLLLRAVVRFGRVSWTALCGAFAWGALLVFGIGRADTGLASGAIEGLLDKDVFTHLGQNGLSGIGKANAAVSKSTDLLIVHLSVVNSLALAAGIVLLLTALRHRITDTVTGLVLGAAAGLGYNFVAGVLYIQIYGTLGPLFGPTGGFEYWIRQSIGVFGGEVTFGALLGAACGAAMSARRAGAPADGVSRGRLMALGLLAAAGGEVGAETVSGWLASLSHVTTGTTFDTLVASPFFWLLPQLPFLILAVALLVTGMRTRGHTLRAAVSAEAAAPQGAASGAITAGETAVLGSPQLRFWALVNTWRRYGRSTALALHRIQSAQLDLAAWRAQRDSGAQRDGEESRGGELRLRVLRLKNERRAVHV